MFALLLYGIIYISSRQNHSFTFIHSIRSSKELFRLLHLLPPPPPSDMVSRLSLRGSIAPAIIDVALVMLPVEDSEATEATEPASES
mmetsp:Transcript_25720/g.75894  ORF Transcript_25720/g.75894 Transcript_25720/m.75894 type:complete len:87 (-) Transcript_25720:4487-4747(-)